MSKQEPPKPSDDDLYQLSKEELVEIIKVLQAEIVRLKEILNLDSKTSSKPPSQDIIKKSEKKQSTQDSSPDEAKRKPGGQPGHSGKTMYWVWAGRSNIHPTSTGVSTLWRNTLDE